MSQERIKAASAARDALEAIADTLIYRANAAKALGMRELAEDLWGLAADIMTHGEALHKCWSDEFNAWCDSVQQGSANMIAAAPAVCDLKARKE